MKYVYVTVPVTVEIFERKLTSLPKHPKLMNQNYIIPYYSLSVNNMKK
jgi:hypothetical protein